MSLIYSNNRYKHFEGINIGINEFLNKTEKELISKEIETLEKASSVELVAVITQRSGDYKLASPMYSIFLVFCSSLYFALFTDKTTFELVQIQLLIIIGFYLLFEYFWKNY